MAVPTHAWELVCEAAEDYRNGRRARISATSPQMLIGSACDPELDPNLPCIHVTLLSQPGLIRELAEALKQAGHRVRITHWNSGLSFIPSPR